MGKPQNKEVATTQVSAGTGKAPVKTTGGGKTPKVPNEVKQKQWNHQADIKNDNNTTLDRNNKAYKKATDNHAEQLNPNNRRFQGGGSNNE